MNIETREQNMIKKIDTKMCTETLGMHLFVYFQGMGGMTYDN